jgi:hypothetical protein
MAFPVPLTAQGGVPAASFGFNSNAYSTSLSLPFSNTVGAPGAPTALSAPGVPMSNVALSNNYIGMPSFETIPAHYVTLVDRNEINGNGNGLNNGQLNVGMLLFARSRVNIQNNSKFMPKYSIDEKATSTTNEFFELIQLNNYLAKMAVNHPTEYKNEFKSAADVLKQFKFIGVFKNSASPTNQWTSFGGAPSSRTINVIVGFRVAVLDYWTGIKLLSGTKIYLVCKKVKVMVGTKTELAYQFLPFCDIDGPTPGLTTNGLLGEGGDIGQAVYVGRVFEDRMFDSPTKLNTNNSLLDSLVQQKLLKTIQIYVGV